MRRLSASRRRHAPIALALLLLILVAVPQARASTVEQQLAGLPTIQAFTGDSASTAAFASNWSAFAWASEKGQDTTTGWRLVPAYPTEAGAFYNTEYTAASGVAAAVTMSQSPGSFNAGRFFSLWIDTTSEALNARSGYELRFTVVGSTADTYDVTLSRWQAGSRTLLASQTGVSFVVSNALALVDQGGTVTAWTNRGAGFTQLLTTNDSTFSQGHVGLGGAGNITRLTAYKAGQLSPPAPTLTATNPASPSSVNSPLIIGSAASGTTVKLFANATCAGSPVATGTAATLASPGIQVTVPDNSTTSFYATATGEGGNASDCSRSISYTERSSTGTSSALANLAVVEAFVTAENPVSGGGRWTKLSWATHPGQVSGSGTTGGWGPYNAYPAIHGAYWNPTTFSDGSGGAAVAATLSAGPSASERWFSLWLDMSSPGSAQTGYELRFTQTATANTYNVTLSKWQAGTRTVLATQSNYAFAAQSSFALVDKGGNVSVWVDAGSGFSELLTAADSTFERGYAGIEGAGNITRVRNFKAGTLSSETATMLASLPNVNSFDRTENPLSGGGGFTKLTWATHPGQVSGTGTSGGWGPYNGYPAIHGAYWNQEAFADAGEGAAVAATLSVSPSSSERWFSLWLDMANPESAQSGYELRFTQTATANVYNVTLSKWQAGVRTALATQPSYTFATQSSFALVDKGGTVSAWVDTGGGYRQILSASDTTFERGYAGIEGAGNITRVRDLKAGDATAGFTGVKHIGEAEAQYQVESNTFSYRAEANAPAMVGHLDPVAASASGTSLPYRTDPVTCATSGHRIKVVYSTSAYPASAPAEVQTAIRSAVSRMNSKIIAESRRSSGNTRALTMRVDCDANGAINIYNLSDGPDNPENIQAAATQTLGDPRGPDAVKYLVFRDSRTYGNASGFGFVYAREARKSSADDGTGNLNRTTTSAAIIYRESVDNSYWQKDTTVHELFHAMGAVLHPRGDEAPYATSGSHCTDGVDIMCYDDEGPEVYTETRCPPTEYWAEPDAIHLDCGDDTYFNASATAGGWLGTHWNTGGSENPFLAERPAEIPPGGADTQTFITLRESRNGPPGSASVYGHVNTVNAGATVVNNAYVNVNFQHFENNEWVTKQIAHPTVTDSYYEVNDFGTLGVGRWRVRTVFPEQGYYHESISPDYKEFTIDAVPTTAFITLDGYQNGAPGTASVHGHVLRTDNNAPASGSVNVNFQKLEGGVWTTKSTAVRTLDANGYWEVVNWGVGVGSWRVRAVYDQQNGYAYAESEYRTFDIQPVATTAYITLDGYQNGAPGTATLHGHVLRTSNGAPASGSVNVNFQKWNGSSWQTMSTAQRTLDGNGYWQVANWGVGVGSWRVRAVYDQQGDYAYSESEYRSFDIQPVATQAYLTVDQVINGSPGRVSVSGNILWAGGGACCSVNVNFQKLVNGNWETMSTATPGLSNGHYVVSNWGVGVGSWRVRAVFNQQGDFGYSESPYHSFTISR